MLVNWYRSLRLGNFGILQGRDVLSGVAEWAPVHKCVLGKVAWALNSNAANPSGPRSSRRRALSTPRAGSDVYNMCLDENLGSLKSYRWQELLSWIWSQNTIIQGSLSKTKTTTSLLVAGGKGPHRILRGCELDPLRQAKPREEDEL